MNHVVLEKRGPAYLNNFYALLPSITFLLEKSIGGFQMGSPSLILTFTVFFKFKVQLEKQTEDLDITARSVIPEHRRLRQKNDPCL